MGPPHLPVEGIDGGDPVLAAPVLLPQGAAGCVEQKRTFGHDPHLTLPPGLAGGRELRDRLPTGDNADVGLPLPGGVLQVQSAIGHRVRIRGGQPLRPYDPAGVRLHQEIPGVVLTAEGQILAKGQVGVVKGHNTLLLQVLRQL